jgi:hypothetical protein
MKKKLSIVNLITRILTCLVVAGLLVACSNLKVDSKTNEKENSTQEATSAKGEDAKSGSNSNSEEIQKKEILWDFRKTDNGKIPNFPKAETKAVFTFLFGDKWDNELAISSRFSGSFTKPNAKETLYYVGGCEEEAGFQSTVNCAHVSWWNAGRIAVYDGTTPVMKLETALGYEVGKITDINGDGINEILSFSGYSNQGATETGATLGHIVDGKYEEIKSFAGYSDSCGNDDKSSQIAKAAVISYAPTTNGKFPAFTEEYFQNKCENSQWRKITKKQFENN